MKNGLINSYPSLRKNISCDILVVGGGLSGALAAYQLASEGYKIVIIDKRDIGTGSTSANTSMVQYEIDEPLYKLMKTFGKEAAIDIYQESVKGVKKLQHLINTLAVPCDYRDKQSLHFADTIQDADGLMKEFECRKMAGIKIRWLTKEQIYASYGIVSEGGLLSETAASLDAYQLTHTLLHAAANIGSEVYDHTQFISAEYSNNGNLVCVDTSAEIKCSQIIYATGYETHELIQNNIGRLISTYACISEPVRHLPKLLTETIFWNTQDPYFYFRTTSDNRILIGGEDEGFKNPEKRDSLIEKKEKDLVAKFRLMVPGVEFEPDFTWAGTFGATEDGLPYIGQHSDFPNSYFMLAYGGNGITFSLMAMDILSDALANRDNRFLTYFKFSR